MIEVVKFLGYFVVWTASAYALDRYKVSANMCMFVGFILAMICYKMYN